MIQSQFSCYYKDVELFHFALCFLKKKRDNIPALVYYAETTVAACLYSAVQECAAGVAGLFVPA